MKAKLLMLIACSACMAAGAQDTSAIDLSDLSLDKLMNVQVITASGYLQTTSQAPSSIIVITDQQIKERGYEQLEDVLRDVPGIDMSHINGYAPTLIYFRGMYGAENLRALLMIDGIVENNIIGSNDMAGPAYSLHNIKRIEIISGPVSALYGANAFGGVINLITKSGSDINGFHIEQGFGSFNTRFEKVSMGLKRNRLELSLAGTLYSTDGPRFKNIDPQYSGSYVDKAYSYNGAAAYYGNKSTTTFGFRTYRTPMGWGTYSNAPSKYLHIPTQGNGNQGIIGIMTRDFRGERSGLDDAFLSTYYLKHVFNVNKNIDITGRAIYRETGTGDDSYVYITLEGNRMIRAKIATLSNRIGGDLNVNWSISEKRRVTAGMEFFQDNVEEGSRKATIDLNNYWLVDGKDTVVNLNSVFLPRAFDIRNNFGSFLQYMQSTAFLGKTEFTLGMRYDKNSYFGDALSPRIALVNKPHDHLTFKMQFGLAFRAPSNLEVYQTPGGNFQIKKEKLRTYEFNTIYTGFKKARLQLNFFRNEMTDVIIYGNLSGFTVDKNPGIFNMNGIEGSIDANLSNNFYGFLNLSFIDAVGENLITHNKGKLPTIAKWKGNVGITANVQDLLKLNVSGNWVGKRTSPRTDPYGPVDGYFLTNFTVTSARVFEKRVSASFTVRNLFNTKWLDPGFRTADGLLYSTVLEQPGRTVYIKIALDLQ